MLRHVLLTVIAVAAAAPLASQQARNTAAASPGLPPIIPVEHFFDNPEVAGGLLAPDGTRIAYLKAWQGKLNVFMRPIEKPGDERRVTSDTARPATQFFWTRDGRQILYLQDKGGNENFHIFAVDVTDPSATARDLTPFDGVRALIYDVPRLAPGRILVGLNKRDKSMFDAWWLDLASGELTMAAENPGRLSNYRLDKQLRVRVATGQNTKGGTVIFSRTTERDPWREVASYDPAEQVGVLRVHPDGRRAWITTNAGDADKSQLMLLDLETGATEFIESDPLGQVDLANAAWSDLTDELLWTSYNADTTRIYARKPWMEQVVRDARKLSDGTPIFASWTEDERYWLIIFNNPVDPGVTYLYDRKTAKATFLYRPRPWLKTAELAPMQPVSYRSRDGLTIHGYLTTPRGVAPKNLPMVLLVHGGPWARDAYGYQPEAQLLANRGYAVLQVNYRGSTGYGKAFFNAAVKEFGRKMHADLIDGVNWTVARGLADSARVGIYGGSYGGYATLAGVTFTPRVFAAAIDYVGPSSLFTLIKSFPPYWRPFLEGSWYRFVGDPDKAENEADLRSRSPLFHLDSIRTPLMIVQGANDPRVTKIESDQLAVALRDRGVDVTYLLAANEGHGFANPDNRMAFYRSMETFLGEHLGGRVEPGPKPEIEAQVAKLTVKLDTLRIAPPPGTP
jgi:dipeptidyl aminopeptidase/acylaminoacyl peptidase